MKRFLIPIVMLSIILAHSCIPGTVFAADEGQLVLSAVRTGDYLDVSVSVKNNPGFAGFALSLSFDKTKLTPASPEALTQTIETIMIFYSAGGMCTNNLTQPGVVLSTLDTVGISFAGTSNITTDFVMFSVRFIVNPEADGMTFLDLDGDDVKNASLAPVELSTRRLSINLNTPEVGRVFMASHTLIKQDSTISGAVNYSLTKDADAPDAIFILAIYNNDNMLTYCEISDSLPLVSGENSGSFTDINVNEIMADTYTVKIFCWDSLDYVKPLAKIAMLTL